jgi:glutamyl/glutaminyl-tRNA synthetase
LQGVRLVRENGTATYNLASVVDDVDFEITHVLRGADHRPNEHVQRALFSALGASVPEFAYVGLVVGDDGKKLSKRAQGATVASLRDAGYPPEAVRRYLDELGLPKHDVHLDLERIKSLSVDVLASLSDEELAERAGVPVHAAALMRGAHDLVEARALAHSVLDEPAAGAELRAPETRDRFAELRAQLPDVLSKDEAKALQRELKAVGGDLRALRLALTGRERGPELWAVLRALPRDVALRRALP